VELSAAVLSAEGSVVSAASTASMPVEAAVVSWLSLLFLHPANARTPASIAMQRIIDISFFIFFPFREDYCGLTRFVHYTKPEHSSQHGQKRQKKEEPHLCDPSIGWFVI
jgi:hypothetical protein